MIIHSRCPYCNAPHECTCQHWREFQGDNGGMIQHVCKSCGGTYMLKLALNPFNPFYQ